MGCKARYHSISRAIARIRNVADRSQSPCPEGLERNRAISVRWLVACTPVQATSHRFELIPIALQRGCVEILNTFLEGKR